MYADVIALLLGGIFGIGLLTD